MKKQVIHQSKKTYSLNMSSEENKTKTDEKESNINVEYGEENLKEVLLKLIKTEYINHYNNSNNRSS